MGTSPQLPHIRFSRRLLRARTDRLALAWKAIFFLYEVYHRFKQVSNHMLPRLPLAYPGDVARDDAKAVGDLAEAKPGLLAQPQTQQAGSVLVPGAPAGCVAARLAFWP